MKPVHIPRFLISLVLVLVTIIFLAGILRAFSSARAAFSASPTATAYIQVKKNINLTPTPEPTPEPTPVPTPILVSADTTGITALAAVIVIIVVIGTILGTGRPHKKKSH